VTLINAGSVSTDAVEETYLYTPTSGTDYATLSLLNNTPSTNNSVIVDWVSLSYVGSNADLLPGVRPPGDTPDLIPNAATDIVSSQPSDGTEVLPSISYSGGGTLVDYSTITSVSWENTTGESLDVLIRQTCRAALSASDSLIGRKIAMRWSLNGGSSWSYDGTSSDNANIVGVSPDFQPRSTQRVVTVADGETLDAEAIVVLVIPDPTSGDPADIQYRGLALSIEVIKR
jgi:hypothetical protein